jgi:DNA-binding transcriptional ArsR family regulator
VQDVSVIDDPAVAEVSLDPLRARLLAALVEPGSASSLAPVVGVSRQKVNYHLRALERVGLVELVEERRKGNMTERIVQATAAAYVISPRAMPGIAPDPDRAPDRLAAHWLLALGSRTVGEVGELMARSERAGQPIATFAVDAEIDFATAADRASFAAELHSAIDELVAKYQADGSGGRSHRLVLGLYPKITRPEAGADPGTATTTTTD